MDRPRRRQLQHRRRLVERRRAEWNRCRGELSVRRFRNHRPFDDLGRFAVTLGSIVFDNPNGYTLTGAGNITFSSTTTPTIDVVSGNQIISGSLNAPNANMTIGDGASLTVDQFDLNTLVIGAGATLTIAPSGSGNPTAVVAAKVSDSTASSAPPTTTTTTTVTRHRRIPI